MRGSADVSYLGKSVDGMIWEFMEEKKIPGLTLAIVQAPYIPRVVGYGVSDSGQRRLASANTMWPVGPVSQAFAAVAVMQLYEMGKLDVWGTAGSYIPELPEEWKGITLLQLLRHASGIRDYRENQGWSPYRDWEFKELCEMAAGPLLMKPGSGARQSATNFLLLTEVVERVSGQSYHDFVTENQIRYLGLKHTGFVEDLDQFPHEDVSLTEQVHQLFKKEGYYIDPVEPAASYDADGKPVPRVNSGAMKGFSDIWASAGDISYWDIGLAGAVLIHQPENRALVYGSWQTDDGDAVPGVAGWQFYHHRGLMDIKGSVPGFSSFLSRFTDPAELVCVTLLGNKEGVDFTNLGRRIAASFGDLMSTGYDDNRLFLYEGQYSVEEMVKRLEDELDNRGIPVFAKFDHAENARQVGEKLLPTTVVVFGSPKVGTLLMQKDQSISLELPLKISVWEDESGSTWLAFRRVADLAGEYGLADHPVAGKMEMLLEELVKRAGSVY